MAARDDRAREEPFVRQDQRILLRARRHRSIPNISAGLRDQQLSARLIDSSRRRVVQSAQQGSDYERGDDVRFTITNDAQETERRLHRVGCATVPVKRSRVVRGKG